MSIPKLRSIKNTPPDEREIAYGCAAGDPHRRQHMSSLFGLYHEAVFCYLTRLVGTHDADDLTQATFIEVALGKAEYDGRASVKNWLFGIATNMARRHRRNFGRKVRLAIALVAASETKKSEDIEDALYVQQKLGRAQGALEKLPLKQREAFVLCVIEELSAKEAGAILEISEAAVWKRVSKARMAIRATMEKTKS